LSFIGNVFYEDVFGQVESCLNDPKRYPITENGKRKHREYDIRDSVIDERIVKTIEDKNNLFFGFPVYSEGEIICKDSDSGENIGTISIKVEISYNLNKDITDIDSRT